MGEALVAKAGLDIALNKSAKMYSPALIQKIKLILQDFNHFYGYTDADRRLTGKTNPTGFFSCKFGQVDQERINGYLKHNSMISTKQP